MAPGFVIDEALQEVVNATQPLRAHNVPDLLDRASSSAAAASPTAAPLDSPSAVPHDLDRDQMKKVDMKKRIDNNAKHRKTKRDHNVKDQTQAEGVSDV